MSKSGRRTERRSRRETEPRVPLGLAKSKKGTAPLPEKPWFLSVPSHDRKLSICAAETRSVLLLRKAKGFHCSGHRHPEPPHFRD